MNTTNNDNQDAIRVSGDAVVIAGDAWVFGSGEVSGNATVEMSAEQRERLERVFRAGLEARLQLEESRPRGIAGLIDRLMRPSPIPRLSTSQITNLRAYLDEPNVDSAQS